MFHLVRNPSRIIEVKLETFEIYKKNMQGNFCRPSSAESKQYLSANFRVVFWQMYLMIYLRYLSALHGKKTLIFVTEWSYRLQLEPKEEKSSTTPEEESAKNVKDGIDFG